MEKTQVNQFDKSITRHIKSSQKKITILFTDIEDSTKYWDEHGDVAGRLMVNAHNRLLFPVIKKFKGKVIKTIGDSIMASFVLPDNAVKAGIAIQQLLYGKRTKDKELVIKVRIGIHTGLGIIEQDDVYGDVVNVAARVEGKAKGSEITVSKDTIQALTKDKFKFSVGDSFVPKGKKEPLNFFYCLWRKEKTLTDGIRFESFLPLTPRQKAEVLVYTIVSLFSLYYFYLSYLRYFILDSETTALLSLHPQSIVNVSLYGTIGLGVVLVVLVILLFRMSTIPTIFLRLSKGIFLFSIGYFLLFVPLYYLHAYIDSRLDLPIHQSNHLFVEILEDDTAVKAGPGQASKTLQKVNKGHLLLLSNVTKTDGITWNKTIIGVKQFGWIPRVLPPKIGVPEKRVSMTRKFYLRMYETIPLGFGAILFLLGFFSFRIKPV